jgi:glutamate/tyrosine decarboxylase-like PLP-dependent enzyme
MPDSIRTLLFDAAERGVRYLEAIPGRRATPLPEDLDRMANLGGPMPETGRDPAAVLALLDHFGSPGTVSNTGGRFFGFVTGAALPATVAANWLAGAWDQNVCLRTLSPVGAYVEDIALAWLLDVLGLPAACGGSLVTGAQMANFTALAAARHALLERAGWNVEEDGLFGAPPITVIVGGEVHVTLLKALALLGLGRKRIVTVPADGQGRMRADMLPRLEGPALVCAQAGNVNTGASDPFAEICAWAHQANAWVHVDGAFGLWAAAAPARAHLVKGVANADSWATDGHKWLNVPQDCGVALVREPRHLHAAMSITSKYLNPGEKREPMQWSPESSRRARGIEVWAALRTLGKQGVAELIERTCRHAETFANRLRDAGFTILNEVVLNQVLVSFGDAAATARVIEGVQADGTCWCGGTVWRGHTAMRISVSSWATTEQDVEDSVAAILRVANRERADRLP